MYLLFDIGGTNMRVATSDDKTLGQVLKVKTPADFNEGVATLSDMATELLAGKKPDQICCGIAGSFNDEKSVLVRSPNLSAWENQPLKEVFQQNFNCPAVLENDADLAALGEASFGAGKDYNIVAYYTVSSGVGGARVVGGQIDANAYGFEPGHQIIQTIGNENFTLEDLIGGKSLSKKYGVPATDLPEELWQEFEKNLTVGLYNSMRHWSPQIIILGGGISNNDRLSVEKITERLDNLTKNKFSKVCVLKKSALGDSAGLWGGIALLNQ